MLATQIHKVGAPRLTPASIQKDNEVLQCLLFMCPYTASLIISLFWFAVIVSGQLCYTIKPIYTSAFCCP